MLTLKNIYASPLTLLCQNTQGWILYSRNLTDLNGIYNCSSLDLETHIHLNIYEIFKSLFANLKKSNKASNLIFTFLWIAFVSNKKNITFFWPFPRDINVNVGLRNSLTNYHCKCSTAKFVFILLRINFVNEYSFPI